MTKVDISKNAYDFVRLAGKFGIVLNKKDFKKLQKIVCKSYTMAYWFALNVPGADIRKCQKAACKDPKYAYLFLMRVPGADKKKCRKAIRS